MTKFYIFKIEYSNSDQNDVPSTQNQNKSSGKVPLEKILFVKDQLIRHVKLLIALNSVKLNIKPTFVFLDSQVFKRNSSIWALHGGYYF